MSRDEEDEKKKREEEAKSIIEGIGNTINSINYANMKGMQISAKNENEQNFINKVNEANSIINSINPRQNVPAPSATNEEIEQGHQNIQGLLSLMDKNTQQEDINNNDIQQEENNPNANSRFRINNTKSKEEVDQQIQQANSQNVQPNTTKYGKGNIDLTNRPIVKNEDGSISTVRSMSFQDDDSKEVLIPTVVNGKIVSNDEAIQHYYDTGEYLGKFDTIEEANSYAEWLHNQQEKLYTTSNSIADSDIRIGLASEQETQNAQELTQTDIKAMNEANEKNKNIEKGGLAKFEEILDTFFDNVIGGVKQTVSGLANVVTTGAALGLRGLEGAAKIFGLEDAGNSLNEAYNSTVEAGSNINEIANYERTVNSQINDDLTKTVGDVTNVISNMVSSQVIGYALPSNVPGVVIQGLSVGGNSAQEVLDENKDNIGQATLTGLAKGYVSYFTENMFDANILTRGMSEGKKRSIQKAVDKLISDKIKSSFGKEAANRVVGIIGENAEELVEDNIDNIIDNVINNKETPKAFSKEWWTNTSDTAKITTISTIIMSLLGLGRRKLPQ